MSDRGFVPTAIVRTWIASDVKVVKIGSSTGFTCVLIAVNAVGGSLQATRR